MVAIKMMTALGEMEALRKEIINQSELPLKPKMLALRPFEMIGTPVRQYDGRPVGFGDPGLPENFPLWL